MTDGLNDDAESRFVEKLAEDVAVLLEGEYDVEDVDYIPAANQVPLEKAARRVDLTAFSIDLRDSTGLLDRHRRHTAGKIHKAFLHVVASSVDRFGGRIRSYGGDGLLAFWAGDDVEKMRSAVECAWFVRYLLREKVESAFSQYRPIDFGIGIDYGEVYVLRAGIRGRERDSDLVFIGDSVNFAVKMAKKAKAPHPIRISAKVHFNLTAEMKYRDPEAWLFKEPRWDDETMQYNGNEYRVHGFDERPVVLLKV